MNRLVVVACLISLSACGGGDRVADTPRAQCDRAAYDDPKVKDLIVARTDAVVNSADRYVPQIEDAHKQAMLRCLRNRGLAPAGGVEPIKNSY